MYNRHIYNREIEKKLHVITYKWKYTNIVNTCNFFLSEFEEMKSCIYRVETANAGMGLVASASSVHNVAWGNRTFYDQESLKNTIFDKSLQSLSNAHPAYCSVDYLSWQKYHCQELEYSQREENHGTDTWVVGYGWLFAAEKHCPF